MGIWIAVGFVAGFPTWWQAVLYSVSSTATLIMVFVIQHTQARQVSSIQRKLDELLRSSDADNNLIAVEGASDDRLQALEEADLRARHQTLIEQDANEAAQ